MSELRQNFATKEWVIISTERAKRPEELVDPARIRTENRPEYSAKCPFCTGNEHMTTDVALEVHSPNGNVRVVPNKFPAVNNVRPPIFMGDDHHRTLSGYGIHDVIIESGKHNDHLAIMPHDLIVAYLEALQRRCADLAHRPNIQYVICFKNHGVTAGASLEHPHSQIIALPIVPSHVRSRTQDAMSYFDQQGECPYCRMWRDETAVGARLLTETECFSAFIPYAAFSPFHLWIMPKRHRSVFFEIDDEEREDLAIILKAVMGMIYFGLNDPDFNMLFRTAPLYLNRAPWFHWYISIVPKVSRAAGFELGSGMYINPALPEESARFLRAVKLPQEDNGFAMSWNTGNYQIIPSDPGNGSKQGQS